MNWLFLFLAAGILFWFIALLYLKSYVKRRTSSGDMLGNLREEIRLLEADIDAKTEQNLALLEEKIAELRRLCTEAEKRVAVYARELGRRIAEEEAFAALDRGPQKPPALSAAPLPGPGGTPVSPASAGTRKESPRKKAASPGSAERVSAAGKKASAGTGRKNPAHRKETSLLDSIEVREITAARAAGAYRAGARLPAVSVPPGGTETAPLPPELRLPAEETPANAAPLPENGSRVARFTASANPIRAKAPPMKERVAELYRAGFSEDLVAARLGISVTEARLYIAMAANPAGSAHK